MKPRLLIQVMVTAASGVVIAGCASPKHHHPSAKTPPARTEVQRMTVTWEQVWGEPAAVEVLRMKPVPLVAGDGKNAWLRVPDLFTSRTAMIFMASDPVNGVADYKVTKGGYLLVACDYSYQGNNSGGWQEERWTRQEFYAHGWREATTKDLGGALVNGHNREQVVFVKKVAAGDHGRLRCNKYGPPHFIVCSSKSIN